MSIVSVEQAIRDLKNKHPIIIFDEHNENEGDLVYPAEIVTKEIIKLMMNKCKGIICQTLSCDIISRLEIPIFKKKGESDTGQTNFVYPVDHVNSKTGISCADRVMIIKDLVNPQFSSDKIVIPGHQNIVKISLNGLKERQGHTESSSELVSMAGYFKSAVICELIDKEGIPCLMNGCLVFGKKYNVNVVLLNDIVDYIINDKTCSV